VRRLSAKNNVHETAQDSQDNPYLVTDGLVSHAEQLMRP